jgi:N-acetyl-anhydromuramyl-L-alanine amidase AmpD
MDRLAVSLASAALALGCTAPRSPPPPTAVPGDPVLAAAPAPPRTDDAIVVAGERFSIGTRVVLWDEPPYYDGYRTTPRFDPGAPAGEGLRYRPGREGAGPEPDLVALRGMVDQLVLHYDVCGTSERCFRVLHDVRGLSVHFLLDVDGMLYQTLDVREQAWHATKANARSVGVEIANLGAYPPGDADALWAWHGVAPGAAIARVPGGDGAGGDAEVAFVEGVVQGTRLVQAELTPAQLDALAKLAAGLSRALPALRPDAPRDRSGAVRDAVLDDAAFAAFQGILGHFHVQANKVDPGPAFPWEAFLADVRHRIGTR